MTVEEAKNISLPKLPQCIIKGEQITQERALEIIRRTDCFWNCEFSGGSNQKYNEQVRDIGGYPISSKSILSWSELEEIVDAWKVRWGYIQLTYLYNDWISTSYIDGPNGWCRPEGRIQFSSNIGKWPSYNTIKSDLKKIASAFPFLNFTCTIMDREETDASGRALISFQVKLGEVTLIDPPTKEELNRPTYNFQEHFQSFYNNLNNPYRGVGINLQQIQDWNNKVNSATVV